MSTNLFINIIQHIVMCHFTFKYLIRIIIFDMYLCLYCLMTASKIYHNAESLSLWNQNTIEHFVYYILLRMERNIKNNVMHVFSSVIQKYIISMVFVNIILRWKTVWSQLEQESLYFCTHVISIVNKGREGFNDQKTVCCFLTSP